MSITEETIPDAQPHQKRWHKVLIAIVLVVLLGGAAGLYYHPVSKANPIPVTIRKSLSFKVYYPDTTKLPRGYSLDTASIRLAEPGVMVFSVNYADGKSLVFSEQQKPSREEINKFHATAIPLHTELATTYGQAQIGVYNSGKALQSIVSLPINDGPWLIITAPSDVNHDDLSKVLQSLKK